MRLTPEKFRSVCLNLQAVNLGAVVVCGQAVNLRATKKVRCYERLNKEKAISLRRLTTSTIAQLYNCKLLLVDIVTKVP